MKEASETGGYYIQDKKIRSKTIEIEGGFIIIHERTTINETAAAYDDGNDNSTGYQARFQARPWFFYVVHAWFNAYMSEKGIYM